MSSNNQDIRNRLLLARLPSMPQILLKLIELCQADEAGMAELAKLIANDAGMTAKVLSVANSAAYHRGGRKVGLLQALGVLGLDMIKTLVISESVFQTFNGFPHSGSTDLRSFWKHSLSTAVMAREIAKKIDYPHTEEAYLAGLLHDVGRLALLAAAPNEYGFNFLARDDASLCAVEQHTLQISHADAGAWLIERWNLDSFMADSILYHHESTIRLEATHPLIRIVHLAQLLSSHDGELPLAADAGSLCKISTDDLLIICDGAAVQVKKAAEYLGIDLSGVDDLVAPPARAPAAPVVDLAQQRLTEEVRHMALSAELGQSFARQKSDTQLLDVVRQNARILFSLENTIVFLMNGSGQALVGVSFGEQQQRLAEFSVALSGGGGMAASVLQRRVAFLERNGARQGLAEEQLMRIFDAECLVCVPIASGSRCLGMLVGGVAAWRVADLKSRERFLQSFGAQAATALEASTRERGEIDQRIASLKEDYRESSRRVAHEVNNPLTIIKNYLGVLDGKLTRQEPVADELLILNEEIDRVGNIMSEFSGAAPKKQAGATEINHIVNDLVRLFRESRFMPPSVQIVARMPEQAAEIDCSADILKQILVNLLKNAVEAMPRGGQIEVHNKGRVQRDGRVFFELCIKDTGPGIPAEVLSKLFSPVRSSKAGQNRGIGLSIVHSLVKKLNGLISCQSTAAGTAFEILLPARDAVAQGAAAASVKALA
ncbi:MAG: HDOD domain-containing protein [Rhodoferax sp.]|uniref:HDOD domain-containing protein n=1 Tax=Rhodoferax sp. TaxID=50421 RepID=UPI0013FE6AA1|nr:HDOD domain-containing protein [Rhodoferax sp.]NDP39640.1 HDOD domain-containing protein [Rhodoferax sp.]